MMPRSFVSSGASILPCSILNCPSSSSYLLLILFSSSASWTCFWNSASSESTYFLPWSSSVSVLRCASIGSTWARASRALRVISSRAALPSSVEESACSTSTMPILTSSAPALPASPPSASARPSATPKPAFMPSSRNRRGRSEALTADGELERHGVVHLELVEGHAEERLEGAEGGEPQHADAGALPPFAEVEDALRLVEGVAGVEEQDAHQAQALGDRKAVLDRDRGELVAADDVRLVQIVEVVDVLVLETVALAVLVAFEAGADGAGGGAFVAAPHHVHRREQRAGGAVALVGHDRRLEHGAARPDRARREAAELASAEAAQEVALGERQLQVVVDLGERQHLLRLPLVEGSEVAVEARQVPVADVVHRQRVAHAPADQPGGLLAERDPVREPVGVREEEAG